MKTTSSIPVRTLRAHVSLNVRDVASSIDFYRAMFGLEPSRVRSGYAKFDVENPPLNLALNQNSHTNPGRLSHLGIQVGSTEDVHAVIESWRAAGLEPREEMETVCCYAKQDKAWVADPDGNHWEVFVVHGEVSETESNTGCCVSPADLETPEVVEESAGQCVPGSGCC
jgi:catechol 2,3-dioxygenase-like lactoylglutathione lyase family enzyme